MDEQFPLELHGIIPGFFRIDPPTISIKDVIKRVDRHDFGAVGKRIKIYKGNKLVHHTGMFTILINKTKDTDGVMSYHFFIQDVPGILLAAYPESEFKPPPFTGRAPLSPVNITGFELPPLRTPEGGYRKHRKTKRKSNKKSNRKSNRKSNKKSNKKSNRNTRSQKRI
jgi:hypothetical protein